MKPAFTISIDYSQSLAQMIQAGKYDWVNSDITEAHFPKGKAGGKVKFNSELFCPNNETSFDLVLAEMKNRKLRPATLPELLAFGKKYPGEQRKYPIAAFGSIYRCWEEEGYRYSPYLCYRYGEERHLGLYWFGGGWDVHFRFLAVRES